MSEGDRVLIRRLPSGVPGLDVVLGGGIPELSFNLIAGAPGTGKTTLAQQIMFANATPQRPALHFTVLGEPSLKMLRYQQQFGFFDLARVGSDVRLLNLGEEVAERDLAAVLERISTEIERTRPGIVVVDSFRTVLSATRADGATDMDVQTFVQRLALRLTAWEVTSLLVGEYDKDEARSPIFPVADGIVWLLNEVERNSSVRKLQATKMRGQEVLPGLHTLRISGRGVEVFPRITNLREADGTRVRASRRISTGVTGLDAMMNAGIPVGDVVLVTGPTGCGKTILATQFSADGVRQGESGVIAVFEEHPRRYVERAATLGFDLGRMERDGRLEIMYIRPLDLSVDETMAEIGERVRRLGATRVVIDSLSGFEVSLAPTFREDFRESFYRLLGGLTALDVTVLSTMELASGIESAAFTPFSFSFLTDDIIACRYIEVAGQLRKAMAVLKMRGSAHSSDFRTYEITPRGLVVGERLSGYRGIITGIPELLEAARRADEGADANRDA